MKSRNHCITAIVLLAAVSAFGQTPSRVDLPIQTYGPNVPTSGGPLPQSLWVANATIALCVHPQATYTGCVANPLITYTDSTQSVPCLSTVPLVQLPGNTCTASTGAAANIGFWYNSTVGSVDYYVTSAYGGPYGPFTITPGGGGGGAVPSGLAQSPTFYQGAGSGATTLVGAGPGAKQITGLVNNGTIQSTDNCTTINNAIAAGGRFVLLNGTQGSFGTMACAVSISMPLSNTWLDMGQDAVANNTAVAGQLNYSGTGWAIQSVPTGVSGGMQITKGNINCTNSGNTGGIQLTGVLPSGNTGNLNLIEDMDITGCNQAINIVGQGLSTFRHIEVQGVSTALTGPSSTPGPLILIGNPDPSGISDLQNSITIEDIGGNGAGGADSPTIAVNYTAFLQINAGENFKAHFRDIDGFNTGIQIGAFTSLGGANAVVNFDVCAGHFETLRGPAYYIDQNSSGKICLPQVGAGYLGPAVVVAAGAHVQAEMLVPGMSETGYPLISAVVSPTGGSLTAGTYFIGENGYNSAASIIGSSPAVTAAWQNYPVMSSVTIASGSTNSIVITYPCVENAATIDIVEGTSSNPQNDFIINTTSSGANTCTPSTPTGTYTFTGSETPGATPAYGNVPWATVGTGGTICATQSVGNYNLDGNAGAYDNQVQDSKGSYYVPTSCLPEKPSTLAPTAGTTTNADMNRGYSVLSLCAPGSTNCVDGVIFSKCSWVSSTETCTWEDLANPSLPNPFVISTATVNQVAGQFSKSGIDTAGVGAVRADCFATSGDCSAYYGDTSIAGGSLINLFGPSSTAVYNLTTAAANHYVPLKLLPPAAATNGANFSSPAFSITSNFWGSAASTSTFTFQNVLGSLTANNPTSTLTLTYNGGATSVGAINLGTLPLTTGTITQGADTVPVVATPTVGNAMCAKSAGPPVVLGYCSTVVSSTGTCTCN